MHAFVDSSGIRTNLEDREEEVAKEDADGDGAERVIRVRTAERKEE